MRYGASWPNREFAFRGSGTPRRTSQATCGSYELVWAIRNGDLPLVQDQVREILTNRPQYVVTGPLYASNSDLGDAPRRFA